MAGSLTVSDAFRDYGEVIVARLRKSFVRAELDETSETVGKKIPTPSQSG